MSRTIISLPWLEPLLVAALHAPLTAVWLAFLSPETGSLVYLAWQIVAFPLVAGACLVSLSPAMWLIERNFTAITMPGHFIPSLVLAVVFAAASSLLILRLPSLPVGLSGSWVLSLLAALAIRRALNCRRAKKPHQAHTSDA
jgi:hypothetical protein